MSDLKKSLFFSFLNKYSILLITIVSGTIIARLLTPEEIGIFSVGASLIGVAHTLRDFGVSNYLIQVKEISDDKIKSAFTITLLMAWSIAGLLFMTKESVAEFYNQAGLIDLIQILSLNFLILPFTSISIALLKREMKFGKLYKITVIATLTHAITTTTLAWLGYGFYSLAWGGFANVFMTAILAQIVLPNHSNFRYSFKAIKPIISFGGQASISSLANEAGNYAPDLIIGKIMGFVSVGQYSRALGFVSLIEHTLTDAINPILLPYFSKELRENRDIKDIFLKITNYYLSVTLPLLGLIALLAYPMVRLLYGSQWDSAIPIAQILCLAMAFKCLNFLMGSVILSLGQANQVMRAQLIYQFLRISVILYGVMHSLLFIAASLVVIEFFGFFIFYSKIRNTNIGLFNITYLAIKNTLILLLVIIPASITYLVHINYGLIDMAIIFTDPLLIYKQCSIIPKSFSTLENLYLLITTSSVALFSWIIVISIFQNDLWNELIKLLFPSKK